jgi:hypothetical protein
MSGWDPRGVVENIKLSLMKMMDVRSFFKTFRFRLLDSWEHPPSVIVIHNFIEVIHRLPPGCLWRLVGVSEGVRHHGLARVPRTHYNCTSYNKNCCMFRANSYK